MSGGIDPRLKQSAPNSLGAVVAQPSSADLVLIEAEAYRRVAERIKRSGSTDRASTASTFDTPNDGRQRHDEPSVGGNGGRQPGLQLAIATSEPARSGDLPGHLEVLAIPAAVERVTQEAQAKPEAEEGVATSRHRADDEEDDVRVWHGWSIKPGNGR